MSKKTRLFGLVAVLTLLIPPGSAAPPETALAAGLRAPAETWVVNNTYDEAGSPCTPEFCSLRQAIQAAADNAGPDEIIFDIPREGPGYSDDHWTITLGQPLPPLGSEPLIIDTASLCGGCQPCVVIDAKNVSYGFEITGTNKTLNGLTIRNAQVHGVYIHSAGAQGNTLMCSSVISNTQDGVRIGTDASGNIIGPANLISDNRDDGVEITNLAHHNVVAGNLIGTDATGNSAWPNGQCGVRLSNGALTNTIGLTTTAGANLISANSLAGVAIASGAQTTRGNVVQNNHIGSDAAGNAFLPNRGGVIIDNSPDNVIGPDNLISGQNYYDGVLIQGAGATGNVVTGNYVGTNAAGTAALNNDDGVVINNAANNTIGPDNVISGNYQDGVRVEGGAAVGNVVKGNYIGTNANGNARVSNRRFGVFLQTEAHHNVIGESFEPNVISGNGYDGDYPIYGGVGIFGSNYNQLCNNQIGTTASGSGALPNGWHGVWLAQSAHDNAIGEGTSASCANTIAWNTGDGVYVHGGLTVRNAIGYINSIHSNAGLGINNDAGGNTELAAPVVQEYSIIDGVYLLGTTCPGCTILVYSDDDGEGRWHETSMTANATTGRFIYSSYPQGPAVTLVAIDAYSNTSEFAGPPVRLDLSIDDALPHVTVNKLPGDADPPAGNTIVELVAKITSYDPTLTRTLQVDVQVPGDVLGSPTRVLYRDQLSDYDGTPVGWSSPGAGTYRVQGINLLDSGYDSWERRVVFRFAIPHATTPATLTLQGTLTPPVGRSVGQQGQDWAKLRLLKQAGEVILTNRTALYSLYTSFSYEVTSFLRDLYTFAQGPPANWSPPSVIYYVDAYSSTLATWDNTQVDYTDEDTANVAAELIDDMIEDWVEDSPIAYVQMCSGSYKCNDNPVDAPCLLIAGDDYIIPFHRRADPTGSEEEHSSWGPNSVLQALRQNNYFFTESGYANLAYVNDDIPWDEGGVELDTGRLIGSSPDVMSDFLQNGVASPSMAGPAQAVVVSAGGSDAAETAEHLVDLGYDVLNDSESPDTVDDGDWQKSDLVTLMQGDYQILHHHHHANEGKWCTPPGDCGGALTVGDLFSATLGLNSRIAANRPVFTSGGCRAGLSPARPYQNTMVSALAYYGASAVMAATGMTFFDDDYDDLRSSEEFLREFWVRAIRHPSDGTLSLGPALRWTKRYWEGHWSVDDEEAKTASEFVLYGVPWVTLYDRSAPLLALQEAAPVQALGPGAITPPQPLGGQTYVVTATFDASGYTIRQVDGFDLVEVPGLLLGRDYHVPQVPLAEVELQLPFDGFLLEVEAIPSNPVYLGTLNIPAERPGVPTPGGDPGGLEETPPEVGVYPPQPTLSRTVAVDGYNLARVYASPLSYNAATDEAVLNRGLALRITYHLSSTVALVGLAANPADLAPGQPFLVTAALANPGAEPAVLTGTLTLEDDLGQVVAVHEIDPFEAPGDAQHLLPVEWAAPDAEGAYSLFLRLWHDGTLQVIGHRRLQVSGGRITGLDVPEGLSPGRQAAFAVTFANRRGVPFAGQATLSIYDAAGTLVATLDAPIEVDARGERMVNLFWDTFGKPVGRYTAAAQVTSGDSAYGVTQAGFDMQHRIFLPLVLR